MRPELYGLGRFCVITPKSRCTARKTKQFFVKSEALTGELRPHEIQPETQDIMKIIFEFLKPYRKDSSLIRPRKTSDHIRKTFSSHSRYNPLLKPQLSSIYLELMKVTYCYIYYLCMTYNLNA